MRRVQWASVARHHQKEQDIRFALLFNVYNTEEDASISKGLNLQYGSSVHRFIYSLLVNYVYRFFNVAVSMSLMESPTGFEPVYSAWQADALTRLSYEDISILYLHGAPCGSRDRISSLEGWHSAFELTAHLLAGPEGIEPPSHGS